jgi:hypothetical protein
MAERQVRITLRDKQTTGGSIPGTALFGEPFVNLYDGILKFSGITGGSFEASTQSGVFEVGSTLYNQRITNRLNINDNFIISGGTGLISTYAGSSGSGLTGKFLSGTSTGFVLADISNIADSTDSYTTGATWSPNQLTLKLNNGKPNVNVIIDTFTSATITTLSVTGNTTLNTLQATTISGNTFFSAGTALETIIYNIANATENITSIQPGSNITTGGTAASPIVSLVSSPSINNLSFSGTATGSALSATTISGGTIYSGSTNLYDIFVDSVNAGTNITIGGTASNPIVNVASSPVFTGLVSATGFTDSSLTAGRVVYVGASGRLVDEAGFEYNSTTDTLSAGHAMFGVAGQTGTTLTVHGDIIVMGDAISGFTSQLYIEDNLIELNYNPTADTSSTSLGAGWSIQDGAGVAGTDVFFDIRGTGTTVSNRGFATNLYDIFIRESGTVNSPNGVRVLAEQDILDGGQY